jgi:hypothetical protein
MKSPWFRLALIVPVLGLFVGCGGDDTTPPTAPSFDASAAKDIPAPAKKSKNPLVNSLTD